MSDKTRKLKTRPREVQSDVTNLPGYEVPTLYFLDSFSFRYPVRIESSSVLDRMLSDIYAFIYYSV